MPFQIILFCLGVILECQTAGSNPKKSKNLESLNGNFNLERLSHEIIKTSKLRFFKGNDLTVSTIDSLVFNLLKSKGDIITLILSDTITANKYDIITQLNIMLNSPCPMRGTPKNECVYFAPVASGELAKCRFCGCTRQHHKISNAFIERYYLPYFLNNQWQKPIL